MAGRTVYTTLKRRRAGWGQIARRPVLFTNPSLMPVKQGGLMIAERRFAGDFAEEMSTGCIERAILALYVKHSARVMARGERVGDVFGRGSPAPRTGWGL